MTSNIQYLLAKLFCWLFFFKSHLLAKLFCWLFFKITKQPNKMIRLKTVQNLLQRSVELMLKKYSLKYNRFLPDTLKCSGLKWFR
uniref:Putative secreted protein ovary overexpressed n=1 Tax=Rhipicephalus microplus TaxID=6941 RepID=A0A6M2DDB6_RHIMP